MYCILSADRPHSSWKRSAWNALFWKQVWGWKNPKTQPSHFCVVSESAYFPKRWCHRPTPWPLALELWTLRCLITTTVVVLHACVYATEDIEPFLQLIRLVVECESQQKFHLINGPHKQFWFPCTSHFHLLLVVFGFSIYFLSGYSVQALCTCSVSSSPFLVNVKRHREAMNMNYSVFQSF